MSTSAHHVDGPKEQAIAQGNIYKDTSISSLVICRTLYLYPTRFGTSHVDNTEETASWQLHPGCTLKPSSKTEIQCIRRAVRPHGVRKVFAIATPYGGGEPIDLYVFTIYWPEKYHDKGYSSFRLGCESKEETMQWHERFAAALAAMGSRASTAGGIESSPSAAVPSSGSPLANTGSVEGPVSPLGTPQGGQVHRLHATTSQVTLTAEEQQAEEEEMRALWDNSLAGPTVSSRRWVPWKHSNGVAIYRQGASSAATQGDDEYLVSVIVRGTPRECLEALARVDSSSTILGPATEVEVLSTQDGVQVLRIRIEAPGHAARVLAPREAVVQRVMRQQERGIFMILFSNVDHVVEAKHQEARSSDVTVIKGDGSSTPSAKSSSRHRFRKPVRMRVGGGYTISRLKSSAGASSPESLLTCVLKVGDLGAQLSKGSWFYRTCEYWGLVDVLVERMLAGIILVKDQVEQTRFAFSPLAMETQGGGAAKRRVTAGAAAGAPAAAAADDDAMQPRKDVRSKLARKRFQRIANAVILGKRFSSKKMESPGEAHARAESPELLGSVPQSFYQELHQPGQPAPFRVRGASYLRDKKKVVAGEGVFELTAVELLQLDAPTHHVSRYLKSVRQNKYPFNIVFQLILPGSPLLSFVTVYSCHTHPSHMGAPPEDPDEGDWSPFDYLLYRFLHANDAERAKMFKLVPHVEEASWVIKQSVGSTPVLIGTKLETRFAQTSKYVEVSVDISSNSAANYITGMVRGVAKSLIMDMAILFEGDSTHELPETLIGAVRIKHLDLGIAKKLDTSSEVPLSET